MNACGRSMGIPSSEPGFIAEVAMDPTDVFLVPGGVLPPKVVDRLVRRRAVPAELRERNLADVARHAAVALWNAAELKIRKGVRLRILADRRVIRLFDYVDYEVSDDGRCVRAVFDDARGGRSEANVFVGSPLPAPSWANNLLIRSLPGWRAELWAALGRQASPPLPEGERDRATRMIEAWCLGVVQGLAARCIDRARLRAMLGQLMRIDPTTLRLARRLGFGRGVSGGVTAHELAEVARWQRHLLEIEAQAPALLDLFWLDRERWSPDDFRQAPLRSLRKDFARMGVTASGWRSLCQLRARPIWKHWYADRIDGIEELQHFLSDWARLHAPLPAGVRLPDAMWETLALTYVDPGSDVVHPPVRWPCHAKVTCEAIAAYHASKVTGRDAAFLQGDWARVVRWAADYGNEGRATLKRTWRGALRAAELDERRLIAKSAGAGGTWPTPFKQEQVEGFVIAPIASEIDLVEEAIAMRHCADRVDRSALGRWMHLVSIRCSATGRRLATACFGERHGRYAVREIRGVANTPPVKDAVRVARTIARMAEGSLAQPSGSCP